MNKALTENTEQVNDAFELQRVVPIAALNIVVEDYRHKATGARHFHLRSDSAENVFLVALKTIPTDSTGVAHILEHSVLCGSEHYPVRDPFFMMLRRSLNTFMNAMTSSDWTAYPFASQIRQDYDNLLKIYLDAVFFSRLDPLDVAQEGHRIEFEQPEDPDSPLVYKGVVFNEMKGAMSSVTSTLWQTLSTYLFPSSTYHFNSGGAPEAIPDLSYDQLLGFYRRHYHPSNAIFMTFGNIPASEHHAQFEELCLKNFSLQPDCPVVHAEKRYLAPLRVSDAYALEGESDCSGKTHIVMGWLWGKNTHLMDILEGHLLSGVLLDNSASPLRKMLETTELGNAPSPLCGMDDSSLELTFVCGLEGSEAEHTQAVEDLVMGVIEDVANHGVAQSELDAILHQLEIHQREIGGDGYPYGLQLIMQGLGTAVHQGDPVELLDLDPVLDKLQAAIKDPEYIKGLARRLLVDNMHRVTLTMTPDPQLAARRQQAEVERLANIKAGLKAEQITEIQQRTQALAQRQAMVDDDSILPRLTLADVPAEMPSPTRSVQAIGDVDTSWYATGTNGLVYQQYVFELPQLSAAHSALLGQYSSLWTELGLGASDYLHVQKRQAATCGSINAFATLRGATDDNQQTRGFIALSAKALNRNYGEMNQLMLDTLQQVRFDEHSRIRELIAQNRAHREQSVTGSGHQLAVMAAASGLTPLAAYNHMSRGIAGIKSLKQLDQSLAEKSALTKLGEQFASLHDTLLGAPLQLVNVCEANHRDDFAAQLGAAMPNLAPAGHAAFTLDKPGLSRHQLWQTNTQVNFCAKAWPTVPMVHPDAPVLSVLGGVLRNGYLHGAIREKGGAYGAGASQDSNIGAFVMYSYRDPRLLDTLQDFDAALNWLLSQTHRREVVEEAILGVIGSLDKPASPAGEAKQHFHNQLLGRTDELLTRFRQRVLEVTEADLKRVTETWLRPGEEHSAIVSSPSTAAELAGWIEQHQVDVQQL
jgi:hypothetical protein